MAAKKRESSEVSKDQPDASAVRAGAAINPLPSVEAEEFWLDAYGPVELQVPRPGYPSEGPGKWLLFVKRAEVDEVWARVCVALETGLLGGHAKVSTARPNPNSPDPSRHVVCVYTSNAGDESDVMRVRAALREIGFVGKIPYKADRAMIEGQYQNRGNKRVSKYFE